jgi:hypothetical protein
VLVHPLSSKDFASSHFVSAVARLGFSSVKTTRFLSKSDEMIFTLRNPSTRSSVTENIVVPDSMSEFSFRLSSTRVLLSHLIFFRLRLNLKFKGLLHEHCDCYGFEWGVSFMRFVHYILRRPNHSRHRSSWNLSIIFKPNRTHSNNNTNLFTITFGLGDQQISIGNSHGVRDLCGDPSNAFAFLRAEFTSLQ